jgi:hypothetical protein
LAKNINRRPCGAHSAVPDELGEGPVDAQAGHASIPSEFNSPLSGFHD